MFDLRDLRDLRPARVLLAGSALAIGLAVAGCGDTVGNRTLSGAGIGAAGGAAVGALAGDAGTGAALGAAGGALTGALTDEDDINLGDPLIDVD